MERPRKYKKRRVLSKTEAPLDNEGKNEVPLDNEGKNEVPLDNEGKNEVITTTPLVTRSNPAYDSLIYDQDYEYELSLIADMEKRERELQKELIIQEENEKRSLLENHKEQIEMRDFHIKQVLRKLKLGSSTNPRDRLYIELLESWMNSDDIYLKTEHADSFHSLLERGMRINDETREYMRGNVVI